MVLDNDFIHLPTDQCPRWTRIVKDIPAGVELIADSFVLANLMGIHYILTAYNKTENKSKTLHLAIAKQGGLPIDSVFGKVGNEVILDVKVTDAGELKLKNRNAFSLRVELARLTQGG